MDIAAACPSLLRAWQWEVVRRWGVHCRLFNQVQPFYFMPAMFPELGATRRPLLIAESGAAQDCPLCGTL
eukprot:1017154-Pyramimonas_sp.AAC.1